MKYCTSVISPTVARLRGTTCWFLCSERIITEVSTGENCWEDIVSNVNNHSIMITSPVTGSGFLAYTKLPQFKLQLSQYIINCTIQLSLTMCNRIISISFQCHY